MIRWFLKYGAAFFVFNTILLSINETIQLGNIIFLVLMGFFGVVLLINPRLIRDVLFHKAFGFLLLINIVNIIYFLLFHKFEDILALKYLLARGVQFSIIAISVYFHLNYYKERFFDHLSLLILSVILLGLFIDPNLFVGRYSGLIWNPNMLSSFSVISFSVLLIKTDKYSYSVLAMLFLLFTVSLATGSRGTLIGVVLAFLVKYGFSRRNIIYGFLLLLTFGLTINLDLDTSINRFAAQDLLGDRVIQFKYAYETLKMRPLLGFGLDKYAYISDEIVPYSLRNVIVGAHNGYLAILIQYGIVFGAIILWWIFRKFAQIVVVYRILSKSEKAYFFIVIYAFFASIYETLMTGINEFHTILFWISLAVLSYSQFKLQYEDRNL
tara:strand:- start:12531 stop:13676 length:1146 start_codon:yes stop_codon:yes gene_type:complete